MHGLRLLTRNDRPFVFMWEAILKAEYHSNDRPDVREAVFGRFSAGLDVGCGAGEVGRALMRDNVVSVFDGIELDPESAKAAEMHYRKVWTGAVESCLESGQLPAQYDFILCADILEHLVDPWSTLRQLGQRLTADGTIVVSIPNLKFAPVMFNLVCRGRFIYQDAGVLDKTHLRFFTRYSLRPLFDQAGLRIDSVVAKKSKGLVRGLLARVLGDFGSAQFIVTAKRAT